jgi:hypothetical protein
LCKAVCVIRLTDCGVDHELGGEEGGGGEDVEDNVPRQVMTLAWYSVFTPASNTVWRTKS